MRQFTFDVKAFLTVHITAPDEAKAREVVDALVDGVEGVECSFMDNGRRLSGMVNSASADGEADLMAIDGEDT